VFLKLKTPKTFFTRIAVPEIGNAPVLDRQSYAEFETKIN